MSLRGALDVLPHDPMLESVVREILALFRRNPDSWLSVDDVRTRIAHPNQVERILGVLAEALVLDFEDAPPRYRIVGDVHLSIELDRFLRRAERHEQRVQTNVARFRRRYHCS